MRMLVNQVKYICIVLLAFIVVQSETPFAIQAVGRRHPSLTENDGVINGHVVIEDGKPAADAVIDATELGVNPHLGTYRTESDDQGDFKLVGLKTGVYQIRASLPGYVSYSNGFAPQLYRVGDQAELSLVRGGVISGRVTDTQGKPLEVVNVNLNKVRDLGDQLFSPQSNKVEECLTDDRGIYRAYGLSPGVYLVSVTDIPIPTFNTGSVLHDSPTFYPSAKREDATEVTVHSGEAVTGIDIRHREEKGHSINGAISGFIEGDPFSSGFSVPVIYIKDGVRREVVAATFLIASREFSLFGVPDGGYELRAQAGSSSYSAPQRIIVKGGDLNDLSVRLLKAGSISGQIVIATPKPDEGCTHQTKRQIEEIFLRIKKIDAADSDREGQLTAINGKGEFSQSLDGGEYRIMPDLPGDNWYVKAITRSSKNTPGKILDIARDGISIRLGESLNGIEVTVMEGAAVLRGRVAATSDIKPGEKNPSSPPHWRVHLVPAEESAAADVLRYAETTARSDGTFELKHLPPGKYFLLARRASGKEQYDLLAWDPREREKLRSEARSLKQEIELMPCQQAADIVIK